MYNNNSKHPLIQFLVHPPTKVLSSAIPSHHNHISFTGKWIQASNSFINFLHRIMKFIFHTILFYVSKYISLSSPQYTKIQTNTTILYFPTNTINTSTTIVIHNIIINLHHHKHYTNFLTCTNIYAHICRPAHLYYIILFCCSGSSLPVLIRHMLIQ